MSARTFAMNNDGTYKTYLEMASLAENAIEEAERIEQQLEAVRKLMGSSEIEFSDFKRLVLVMSRFRIGSGAVIHNFRGNDYQIIRVR